MAKTPKSLLREFRNNQRNIRFGSLTRVVEALGFKLCRSSGSHWLYEHPEVPVPLNLQEVKGEAKPYQVKQLLKIVDEYSLEL